MKIKLQELRNLLNTIESNKIQQLKVKKYNFELQINSLQTGSINLSYINNNPKRNIKARTTKKQQKSTDTKINNPKNILTITSPMVGTFYRASSPNEAPFVKIQDNVQSNQTVCIIEAMKLMNEIEAEVNGQIVDILVDDGEFVDCGQALMIVEPAIS